MLFRSIEKGLFEEGITSENYINYLQILERFIGILTKENRGFNITDWSRKIEMIYNLMNIAKDYDSSKIGTINDFKIVIGKTSKEEIKDYDNKELNVICLNPAFGFFELIKRKPRTIILTSGTLSPMNTFETELRIEFPIQLKNNHIIDVDQVSLNIVTNYCHY